MKKHIQLFILVQCVTCIAFAQTKLFPIETKNKWGYMNTEGKICIPAIYDFADDFTVLGTALVALRNQPCVINTKGKILIDTGIYQYIGIFSNGLASATTYKGEKYYIDTLGNRMINIPKEYYECRPFSDGVAIVSIKQDEQFKKFGYDLSTLGYKFAVINKSGAPVTEFIFDDADDFVNGRARVKQGTKFGLINTKGEWIIKPQFNNIGNFAQGLAVVDVNGKYGYIDTTGKIVIKPEFDYAYNFSEGLAGVWQKGKYGFINTNGELAIPAQFDMIKPFAEGKAPALKEGKWGFINHSGNWVLRNVFDNTGVFSEGKCAVLVKKSWGFIDAQGALIIPAEFDAVGSFNNGIADVVFRDMNLYINARGQLFPIIEKK
jgi:hypothetical protein